VNDQPRHPGVRRGIMNLLSVLQAVFSSSYSSSYLVLERKGWFRVRGRVRDTSTTQGQLVHEVLSLLAPFAHGVGRTEAEPLPERRKPT
jgi:hypothetical protein